MGTLEELGESRLIEWLIGRFSGKEENVVVGNGNDAAVVKLYGDISFKVDTLVLTSLPKFLTYYDVGWKAVMACASDLAAVGSEPKYALVSFSGPRDMEAKHFRQVFRGIRDALRELNSTLLGGDLSETSELCLGIVMLGKTVGKPLLRRKARPGDLIAVSKLFGLEPLGLRVLYGKITVDNALAKKAIQRFRRPKAEIEYGTTLSKLEFISSCTDSSDGLIIAVKELIGEGMDAVLHTLPLDSSLGCLDEKTKEDLILWGGEEYALVYTYDPSFDGRLVEVLRKIGRKRIVIGEVVEGSGKVYLEENGALRRLKISGWRQFQSVPLDV